MTEMAKFRAKKGVPTPIFESKYLTKTRKMETSKIRTSIKRTLQDEMKIRFSLQFNMLFPLHFFYPNNSPPS